MSETSASPTAVLGRRFLAYLVDTALYLAALAVPLLLLGERSSPGRADGDSLIAFSRSPQYAVRVDDRLLVVERSDLIIAAAVAVGLGILFHVLVQGRFGWTIGKALTGLRTVDADGGRPGIPRALVRTLVLAVDVLPAVLVPLVGGLVAVFTPANRRLGDLAAGTFVVRRDDTGQDPTADVAVDSSGWEPVGDGPEARTLGEGQSLRVGDAAEDTGDPAGQPVPVPQGGGRADDVSAPATAKGPAYQPQWDPARQAYLQWDPRRQTWLQFDDDAGEWRPIG